MQGKFEISKLLNKRIICALLAAVLLLHCFLVPEIISHGAENTTLPFNGNSTEVSISGYSAANNGAYTFRSKLIVNFEEPDETYFNRYTIEYTADECIGGTIYYKLDNRTKSEDFFIESGTKASFSSLIDRYLDSKTGNAVEKITFSPLSASTATITVHAVKTVVYDVYKSQTAYIENDRFKVGCCLIWGGGLNYIEDKKDNDTSVTNMLNHCDTGRLVQQSYYGTMESPYITATYNGSRWSYNPVQGGDQYGNKSKLVDFSINEDTIYVKCRPLDWAKNNEYTFSYMENVYKLESDCIKVDNRFIDFSGYNHGATGRHQELPAFYTISYLDTFTFYNGTKPWTGGSLTVKKDLPFWGDSGNQSKCYFNMKKGNSETWCAWTSSEKGYGLGLYTPDISILLAGRHAYNGSKDPADGATNYVAPLITTIMKNYEPFQYSYYITGGTVDSIRTTFTKRKTTQEFTEVSYDTTKLPFDNAYEISAFGGRKEVTITHDESTGSAVYTAPSSSSSADGKCDSYSYINFSSSVNTKDYRYLVFSYMVPTTNKEQKYSAEFFVCTGSRTRAAGGYSHKESLTVDGKFHTLIIDMWNTKTESGDDLWPSSGVRLNSIRLDFDNARANDNLYITGFGLAGSSSEANRYASEFLKVSGSSGNTGGSSSSDTNIVIPTFAPDITSGVATAPGVPTESSSGNTTEKPSATASPSNGGEGDSSLPQNTEGASSDMSGDDATNGDNDETDMDVDTGTDEDTGRGSKISVVFIVGMAALGTLIVAAVVVLIIVLVKRKKKNMEQ